MLDKVNVIRGAVNTVNKLIKTKAEVAVSKHEDSIPEYKSVFEVFYDESKYSVCKGIVYTTKKVDATLEYKYPLLVYRSTIKSINRNCGPIPIKQDPNFINKINEDCKLSLDDGIIDVGSLNLNGPVLNSYIRCSDNKSFTYIDLITWIRLFEMSRYNTHIAITFNTYINSKKVINDNGITYLVKVIPNRNDPSYITSTGDNFINMYNTNSRLAYNQCISGAKKILLESPELLTPFEHKLPKDCVIMREKVNYIAPYYLKFLRDQLKYRNNSEDVLIGDLKVKNSIYNLDDEKFESLNTSYIESESLMQDVKSANEEFDMLVKQTHHSVSIHKLDSVELHKGMDKTREVYSYIDYNKCMICKYPNTLSHMNFKCAPSPVETYVDEMASVIVDTDFNYSLYPDFK